MDEELYARFQEDPLAEARHRTTLHRVAATTSGSKFQMDNPEVLTDAVMTGIVELAYLSTLPMFREDVNVMVNRMTDPVMMRAYLSTRTAVVLFKNNFPGHRDFATDDDWEEWIESMSPS